MRFALSGAWSIDGGLSVRRLLQEASALTRDQRIVFAISIRQRDRPEGSALHASASDIITNNRQLFVVYSVQYTVVSLSLICMAAQQYR